MASPRISIEAWGGKELSAQFERLTWKMQREVLMPAMKRGAYVVRAAAMRLAPVKTGRMRRSIHVVWGKFKRKNFGYVVKTGTREELGIPRDAPHYYPSIVEYGGIVGARARTFFGALRSTLFGPRVTRVIPARPFMRPALAQSSERVVTMMRQAVAEGCRKLLVKTRAREARRG